MRHKNPMKFENEIRLKELDIINSLKKAGINENDTICDYGAGTGVFTLEASKLTKGMVYALDIDPSMLNIIKEKAKDVHNIQTIQVEEDKINLESKSIDLFIIVTVIHEIKEVPEFIKEVRRVLKPFGRVLVIDFHKKDTPMGPPADHRMSEYQTARHFFREDIVMKKQCNLGENLYLLLMEKEGE
ncbi:MAG: methyltransferase domain-containing protein [Vallitaleaceae bacterium]|nr:methyltransferase domain-containing protein [Vallitaleaceae bacterium]